MDKDDCSIGSIDIRIYIGINIRLIILRCRIWGREERIRGRKKRNDHADYFFSGFEEKMGQLKIIIDFLYLVRRRIYKTVFHLKFSRKQFHKLNKIVFQFILMLLLNIEKKEINFFLKILCEK